MNNLKNILLKKIENIFDKTGSKEFLLLEGGKLLIDNKEIVEFFYSNSDKKAIIDVAEELYYSNINIFNSFYDNKLKEFIISYIDKNQLYWVYNCYTKNYIEILYNDLKNNKLDDWELETLQELNNFL